jgi:hypothetical protein
LQYDGKHRSGAITCRSSVFILANRPAGTLNGPGYNSGDYTVGPGMAVADAVYDHDYFHKTGDALSNGTLIIGAYAEGAGQSHLILKQAIPQGGFA